MTKLIDVKRIGEYLSKEIEKGRLCLKGKDTINYDTLFNIIYSFLMLTKRKDGKSPGNRPLAIIIACEKLIAFIKKKHSIA